MTDDLISRRPRTRLSFSEADMARLRDLYYDRDVPMTQIAKSFGISTSTLYHWIAEMDWPRRSATFPIRTQPHRAAVEVGDVGAAPHPSPLPGLKSPVGDFDSQSADVGNSRHPSGERGSAAEAPFDPQKLALDVAVAARRELAAIGDVAGPMSLVERKRRADIIASLSRSIQRIDKSFELRAERKQLKRLVKQQQEKINALQNAGLIDVQRAKFAVLKAEFAAVAGSEAQSAPLKAQR